MVEAGFQDRRTDVGNGRRGQNNGENCVLSCYLVGRMAEDIFGREI